MKRLFSFSLLLLIVFGLTAQNITISFQPQVTGNQIDTTWVTNQRTYQNVKLIGGESLVLTVIDNLDLYQYGQDGGYLYPNPGYGDATLVFSTSRDQDVTVSVYNISGQELGINRQELSPGQHTFRIIFPVIGLFIVSVQTHDSRLSLKAAVMDVEMQDCGIDYAGSENQKELKIATAGKTMDYKVGDILHYSVHSGNNNTIVTDSPIADKIYSVEFYECIDPDNNSYPIVKIGSQWCMASNLKTSRCNDGTILNLVADITEWKNINAPGYCWYLNDSLTYGKTYGALYNWNSVNTGKLCPAGWHVPSDTEWTTLTTFLGGEDAAGSKMKETGTEHWYAPNTGATNESGFSGLPGGLRFGSGDFGVEDFRKKGYWWSSTKSPVTYPSAYCRVLSYLNTNIGRMGSNKEYGYSVRCIRD